MYFYEINGIRYIQKPLVLGQIKQLTGLIDKVIAAGGFDLNAGSLGLIATLGDNLPLAMAVILTPEGADPRAKDLAVLSEELELQMTFDQVAQAVADFFVCNPILSLLEKLQGMVGNIKKAATKKDTGSTSLSASSPEATSQSKIQSSGESHLTNADPI